MIPHLRPFALILLSAASAATLGGCKLDNRPLLARNSPAPPAVYDAADPGPLDAAADALPTAGYLPTAEAYAYPARAYAMSRSFRQSAPSYAFAYGEEQPWAWQAADEGLMFAEPVDEGYRYYYYEPGASDPYYVQDADYGYAYGENGALLALFDAAGALISNDRGYDARREAGQYWTRARDLNRAYQASPRRAVQETVWRDRAPTVWAAQDRWFDRASRQPAWRPAWRGDRGAAAPRWRSGGGDAPHREIGYTSPAPSRDDRTARREAARHQAHAERFVQRADRAQARQAQHAWRDQARAERQASHAERRFARQEAHGPAAGPRARDVQAFAQPAAARAPDGGGRHGGFQRQDRAPGGGAPGHDRGDDHGHGNGGGHDRGGDHGGHGKH